MDGDLFGTIGLVPLGGAPVYDPMLLTKEQLLDVMQIDERHRIVDVNGKRFIVLWDDVLTLMEANDE